jgi:hypothetical protein
LAGTLLSKLMIPLLSLCLAICICAEQTFTEASAMKEAFSPAFSAALDVYLASSLREDVNREIAALSDQDYKDEDKIVTKLVQIIESHPLRELLSFKSREPRTQHHLGIHSQTV